MSTNCVVCVKNKRTGFDLLCDDCRANEAQGIEPVSVSSSRLVSSLLPGEEEAISQAINIGKKYGYGNLIAHLRREWAESLIADGIPEKHAIEATITSPYPIRRQKRTNGKAQARRDEL